MNKTFPIDFVRQFLFQTLLNEHIKNPKYYGGVNQVSLMSFYEQLEKEDEVDRYVDIYRDLTDQQNRTGLIMNGTLLAPENPTITNVNQCLIIPMSFTCAFRVKLENRDTAIATINNLFAKCKGRKFDIAEFNNGKLFMVGTIANNVNGTPLVSAGDFLTDLSSELNVNGAVSNVLTVLQTKGFTIESGESRDVPEHYYYVSTPTLINKQKLKVVWEDETDNKYKILDDDGTFNSAIFPPDHEYFTKYKLSVSFDSLRCDEPRNLNANEYCVISFGGSATLVSKDVALGNDLTKLAFKKKEIVSSPNITIGGSNTWLEPLELPSGNNADTQINQLMSNKFLNNTHTDSLTISMQYTFILDKSIPLLNQMWRYARYGTQADSTTTPPYISGITPNMIFEITEIWSYWGNVDVNVYRGKIVESIDIENSESDTLTITIPIQVQGENN